MDNAVFHKKEVLQNLAGEILAEIVFFCRRFQSPSAAAELKYNPPRNKYLLFLLSASNLNYSLNITDYPLSSFPIGSIFFL